ncbi:hypothetical protein [Fimbriiglobus ruber]|uniref:Uncharacterized protein n=1 Tax=Fimbriiglobus ruber TaxID=1908690 RepID=A0A225E9H6_9BACT|nr:hypothetical protein [Fimbriiglobus ruber]OWK45077.1 hypothetical protein FRUB_01408 [Fimbriiglobus ruber]
MPIGRKLLTGVTLFTAVLCACWAATAAAHSARGLKPAASLAPPLTPAPALLQLSSAPPAEIESAATDMLTGKIALSPTAFAAVAQSTPGERAAQPQQSAPPSASNAPAAVRLDAADFLTGKAPLPPQLLAAMANANPPPRAITVVVPPFSEPAPARAGLGVPDVIRLAKQGQSDELILKTLRDAHATFRLAPRDVVTLKESQVSDRVIVAMMALPLSLPVPSVPAE